MRTLTRLVVTLSLLPAALAAQTAPTEPPRREGTAEASFVGTSGNSATQSLGLGVDITWRVSNWQTRLKGSYAQNKVGGDLQAQTLTLTGRGERPFTSRAALFGQYGFARDQFAGIVARHTAESGVSGTVIKSDRHTLTADAGGGYANEHRKTGATLSTAIAAAGAVYTLKLSPTSDFTEDARFNAAIPRGADWRYVNTVAVTASMTTRLSLKASNTVRYVNLPAPGFHRADVLTGLALVARF